MNFNPDNTKITSGRDSHYRSNDVKSRPTANASSRKDFKKVLEKTSNEDENENETAANEINEETEGTVVAMEEETKKKSPPSLFDLTSGKTANPFGGDNKPARPVASNQPASPAAIYSQLTSLETKKTDKEMSFIPSDNLVSSGKDKFTTRFATEQTDLSYVNPLAATPIPQASVNLNLSTEKAIVPVANIQQIIDQMVGKVVEMKNAGKTETILTLKNVPLFEGATVVVTGFDSAKNEFNITIENLTQAGKQLMDQQNNRDSLLSSLQQKGYAVHILSTTTLVENLPVASLPQEEQQRGRQQSDEEEKERQRRRGQG